MGNVKPKLNCYGNLVHILLTRSSRSDEIQLDFVLIDRQ